MKAILPTTTKSVLLLSLLATTAKGSLFLINVDTIGNVFTSSETGPAAIGTAPTDFWNAYSRDDANFNWQTYGAL